MITPKIPLLKDGQILSVDVVNSIIKRTEYAGDLLKQYKLIAGNEIYVEPHYVGTRVSYLQPVGGGGTPQPVTPPNTITISGSISRFTEAVTIQGTLANKIDGSELQLYIGGNLVSTILGNVLGFSFNYNTQQVNLGTQAFVRQVLDGNLVGISNTIQLQYASTGPQCGILYSDNWENIPSGISFFYGGNVKQEQLLKWGFFASRSPGIMQIIISGTTVVNTGCFGGSIGGDSTGGTFLLPGLTRFNVQINKCGGTLGSFIYAIQC